MIGQSVQPGLSPVHGPALHDYIGARNGEEKAARLNVELGPEMDALVKQLGLAQSRRPSREEAEQAARTLIAWAGDDPSREGLIDTPKRVVRAYEELFSGYGGSPETVLDRTFEEVGGYDDMVLVKDIPFSSHCEHHVLPFVGRTHVAYLPDGGVVGLSKLARLIEIYARRLQTQENLTVQIAEAIQRVLRPRGVAVMVEAEHLCMSMRGVAKAGAITTTTRFTGVFRDDPAEQVRFFTLLRAKDRG